MPKSKQQKRLEALDRREMDVVDLKDFAGKYPTGEANQWAAEKIKTAATDIRNLEIKLGMLEATA